MAFTNTVETIGDAALTRSIIDKSITELNCNITLSIRQQAFRACAALTSVNFPNVTSVALGAFWNCTALAKADFSAAVAFANNAFYGCTALTALILRSTDQLCTISGTPFASSAIASGTGYIYVPAALVDSYKADGTWSAYASQIRAIEDWIEICDPYSWAAVFKALDAGTYADVYKVGDLIPLDLGTEGEVNMQIAGIGVDTLTDGGTAPLTFISKELLTTSKRWNPSRASTTDDSGATVYTEGTGTIGGWEKSELRAYYNDTLLPLIPEEVRNRIVSVTKTQTAYNTAGSSFTQTTEETVWPPSSPEVSGSSSLYYALFKNTSANRIKYKVGASSASTWWLRSANSGNTPHYVYTSGNVNNNNANISYALALGFCI